MSTNRNISTYCIAVAQADEHNVNYVSLQINNLFTSDTRLDNVPYIIHVVICPLTVLSDILV